jgi:hypothetical protein
MMALTKAVNADFANAATPEQQKIPRTVKAVDTRYRKNIAARTEKAIPVCQK